MLDDAPSVARRSRIERHESELGRWVEVQCLPHPALAGHVELIFHSEGAVTYRRDRLLPRGQTHLLINLGPPQYLVNGAGRRTFSDLWFSGQHETFLETEAPHGTVLMAVVFRAFGAYAALGMDQDALAGEVLGLADLLGDRVRSLHARLLETADVFTRLAVVEGWLLERIARGRALHPVTPWAAERIASAGGQLAIRDLAARSGYSEKHLISLFRREVGLTPKSLARIHRFHTFLGQLRRQRTPSWSRLAVDCGFYDQSHLIREVRRFTGCTPRQLAAAPTPDDVTLALA